MLWYGSANQLRDSHSILCDNLKFSSNQNNRENSIQGIFKMELSLLLLGFVNCVAAFVQDSLFKACKSMAS